MMKVVINSKIYHNRNGVMEVLKNISISFESYGLYAIVGDSGVGKTTLLNIIAQEDTDFEGRLDINGSTSYVKQDIELLETLKVSQHLYMACNDTNAVAAVMENLKINQLKNKKIKHLSLGQKRRVQLACALLMQCEYLLCDEPTASLDKENCDIIMNELKRRSKTQCVILVSHDENTLYEYADAIFHLEKDSLTEERKMCGIHQIKQKETHAMIKKEYTFFVAMQLLYSRFFEHAFRCVLSILLVLSMVGGTMFFSHIHTSQKQKDTWYYEENVVMSQPKHYEDVGYAEYDTYTQDDLNMVREICPEIIGYEWGWNIDLYLTFADQEEMAKGYTYHPFLMDTLGKIYVKEDKENGFEGWEHIAPMLSAIGIESEPYGEEYYSNRRLRVFQMFNIEELPLSTGYYPTTDYEVILDTTAAAYYCNKFELNHMEDLIGKEISFYTYPNAYDLEMISEHTKFPARISGITYLNSQRSSRIYTKSGAYDRFLAKNYQFQSDLPEHMFMNLLLDEHNEQAIATVNDKLESDRNKFVWSQENNAYLIDPVHEMEIYQSPFLIYTYSIGVFILILLILVISEWLLRKRSDKERHILKRFGYDARKVKGIELILYYMVAFIIVMPLIQTYAPLLNDAFFKIHYGLVTFIVLVCAFIHMGVLSLISSERSKK